MLKNIKNNLNYTDIVKKDDDKTKIYIVIKTFLKTLDHFNKFFQSEKKDLKLRDNINISICDKDNVHFLDDESNMICIYKQDIKELVFDRYYDTQVIRKKMSVFLIRSIPKLCEDLESKVQEEIDRRQNKLLCILDEKPEKKPKDQEKTDSHESFGAFDIPSTPKERKNDQIGQNEIIVDDDFVIIS